MRRPDMGPRRQYAEVCLSCRHSYASTEWQIVTLRRAGTCMFLADTRMYRMAVRRPHIPSAAYYCRHGNRYCPGPDEPPVDRTAANN